MILFIPVIIGGLFVVGYLLFGFIYLAFLIARGIINLIKRV